MKSAVVAKKLTPLTLIEPPYFSSKGVGMSVTIVLVHYLDEVNSTTFNFKDREIVKSGKMFKVSSKARFLHEQVRQKWPHAIVFRL